MVHKKYTYKNGKRFGPYYYENKRVNGKIVTRYIGPAPRMDFKSYALYFGCGVVGVFLIFLLFQFVGELAFFSPEFDRLDINIGEFEAGELVVGNVEVKLREGE